MNQKGTALIFIVIIISSLMILLGVSLGIEGFTTSYLSGANFDNKTAFYYAESGIHDALKRLTRDPDCYISSCQNWTINFQNGEAKVSVSANGNRRTIISQGKSNRQIVKIKTEVTVDSNRKIQINLWQEID